jgi:hypothetical protein
VVYLRAADAVRGLRVPLLDRRPRAALAVAAVRHNYVLIAFAAHRIKRPSRQRGREAPVRRADELRLRDPAGEGQLEAAGAVQPLRCDDEMMMMR